MNHGDKMMKLIGQHALTKTGQLIKIWVGPPVDSNVKICPDSFIHFLIIINNVEKPNLFLFVFLFSFLLSKTIPPLPVTLVVVVELW